MAIAATIMGGVGAVGVSLPHRWPSTNERVVATGPGKQRFVRLADSSEVALNGGTRILVLDGAQERKLRLDRGEASFVVRNDSSSPFEVEVGGIAVRDVGTRFDITRDGESTAVSVADGAVLFQPDGAAVRLTAGKQLRTDDRAGQLIITPVDPAAVGAWRAGRLIYRAASLTEIAVDLARVTGFRVGLAAGLETRRFSGVITLRRGNQAELFVRVAALLDLSALHGANGWELESRAGPAL